MSYKYTPDHEWVALDVANGVATIGITPHAQDALGDVVFVELPAVGTSFQRQDVAGTVESVKAASDIYAPMAGEVVAINEDLRDDPSLANSDPQGQGWFFKLRVTDPTEFDALLDAAGYDELVRNA